MAEPVKKATAPKAARKSSTTKNPSRRKATPTAARVMPSQEEIAKLAHRFWAERGHHHGQHEEDWLRAEREIFGKAS